MTELLADIPENPAPDWGHAARFIALGGKAIRYALFPAQGRPLHGTVIILSGRNECIEKYFETIRDLSARGLGAAIMDWRGQGGSDRLIRDPARGYIDSFQQYVLDFEQFFADHVLPDCRGPFYILGHSTGSLIALLAAPNLLNRVRRMVLVAPLLELTGQPVSSTTLRRVSSLLYNLGLGSIYVSGGARPHGGAPFAANKLTTDLGRYTRNNILYDKAPHLAMGGPTVAWMHAACVAADTVRDPDFMARIQIPILMIAAGADEVVSTRTVEDYARRLRLGSQLTIDGARHEILQEADVYREQFFAAFDAFVPGESPEI
ncbi:MAG: alpha/beta hydrolase [Mesorhizobium sp.]|nr:alpha/beta hydrolase [Mesorhizobium sp.]